MSEELKQCPFCGGEDTEIVPGIRGDWFVGCLTCNYQIRCPDCTEEETIRYWNTRPAEDALKAEVEKLKVELDARKSALKIAYNDIKWLYEEVEKWKKMFYDLDDKYAKVSTEIRRKRGER